MPIYEFVCQRCDKEFELLVSSSRWKGAICPGCGSNQLKKKLSSFAPHATGSAPATLPCGGNPSRCACACGPRHSH